jgi:cyanophycinase-like exopeptidase
MNVETTTADAANDPLESRISFTTGLFAWPALLDTITDTHLVARDRIGRTIAFIARIFHDRLLPDAREIYALGIDGGSAVVVDPDGAATVLNGKGGRGAYLVRSDTPPLLIPGHPLHYTVEVTHLARNGERFDLLNKQTPEPWYTITVDGTRPPYYNQDPYNH